MNEFILFFKDAPLWMQGILAYAIIKGGHFGIDRYKGRNGDLYSPGRIGQEIDSKLAPLVKQVEKYYQEATVAWEGGAERHERMIKAQADIGKALNNIEKFMAVLDERTRRGGA